MPYQTPVTLTLACTDANGNPLTRAIASNPAHGSLSAVNQDAGTVTYTPNAGYRGSDSFTFTANDGAATSAPATVRIAVGPCKNLIQGTAGRDLIAGTSRSDRVHAGAGRDVVDAREGSDCVSGQTGSDAIHGERGHDRLFGGRARDVITGARGGDRLSGDRAGDRLFGGRGSDRIRGGKGRDLIGAARGRDRVDVADGRVDRVNCGRGRDRAIADEFDRLTNCERVSLR